MEAKRHQMSIDKCVRRKYEIPNLLILPRIMLFVHDEGEAKRGNVYRILLAFICFYIFATSKSVKVSR